MTVTALNRVLRAKKATVLVAMQPDENTFAMPEPEDFLQVRNLSLTPLAHSTIELNEVCSRLGSRLKGLSAQHVKLSFECVFRGAGTTAEAKPNVGKVLRACGFAETSATGVVTYAPVEAGFESASVVVYMDGNKHALMGAKGKVSAEWKSNDYPIFKVELVGLFVDVEYENNPETACYAPPAPLEINHANTTWSLHNITTSLYSASVEVATNPELRDLPGQYGIEITDRITSGAIEFAASRVDDKNWYEAVRNLDVGPLNIVHGTVAGNIVEMIAHKVQLLEPQYGEQNNRRSNSFNLNMIPSPTAGEYEIAFKFR